MRNETNTSRDVYVKAYPLWEDEVLLGEDLTLESGEQREWDSVLTENVECGVSAEIEGEGRLQSDGVQVEPGSETAPAA